MEGDGVLFAKQDSSSLETIYMADLVGYTPRLTIRLYDLDAYHHN